MVSDDLPSAWRLQSLLLGAGLVPRVVQLADLDALSNDPADLVVFDRGVPGAAAIEVLGRVRPPQGADVVPALFLSGGGGVATSAPGERRLDLGASDKEIVAAVDDLIASTPRPEPRVMPPIDEIDVGEIVGSRPSVVAYRRRRPSLLGPLAALALLLGAVAGYSAIVASREPAATAPTPTVAATSVDLAAASVVPAAAEPIAHTAAEPTASVAAPAAALVAPAPAEPTATVAAPVAAHVAPVVEPMATLALAPTLTPAASDRPASPRALGGPVVAGEPSADRAANAPAGEREGPPSPTPIPLSPIGTSADRASGPSDVESGLEGRVTDASTGHGLPGAVVAYRGPVEGQITTGGDGRYRVPNLPPGAYELVAVAPGYAQARNRAGVVADTLTTDNLALAPMAGASVVPFQTVTDQRSGQAVAAYGYPVRPGDTLRAIAERAGTTVDEILALNRIDDADRLEPGRLLYLPASTFGQK